MRAEPVSWATVGGGPRAENTTTAAGDSTVVVLAPHMAVNLASVAIVTSIVVFSRSCPRCLSRLTEAPDEVDRKRLLHRAVSAPGRPRRDEAVVDGLVRRLVGGREVPVEVTLEVA